MAKNHRKKNNIVLITIDALRADHIGCLGYLRQTTPNLDKLAHSGILFSKAFANGPTTPFSFPSIMASIYPLMLNGIGLPTKGLKTIAEILKKYGYSTGAWHPNPFISSAYNYHRGFDVFMDPENWLTKSKRIRLDITNFVRKWPKIHQFARNINNRLLGRLICFDLKNAKEIFEEAGKWITKASEPFFVWMHLNDTHHPWFPRREHLSKFRKDSISLKRAKKLVDKLQINPDNIWENINDREIVDVIDLYDVAISYTDEMIGKFLESSIELENTIIIITSDHGEEFGEHNGFHRIKPYDEMLHVPLIIAGGDLPKRIVIDNQISLIELAPTIIDFCGFPEVEAFQGKSLLPLIICDEYKERTVISEYNRRLVDGKKAPEGESFIIRTNGWKYMIREVGNELYHLETDPKEKTNLVEQRPEIVKELEAKLMVHITQLKKNKLSVGGVDLSNTLREQLRALGYFD